MVTYTALNSHRKAIGSEPVWFGLFHVESGRPSHVCVGLHREVRQYQHLNRSLCPPTCILDTELINFF